MPRDPMRSHRYQRTRALWIAALPGPVPCDLCGQPVDPRIPGRHPWGITIEHRTPVRHLRAYAGDNWNLLLSLVCDTSHWGAAHRQCQARQGGASSVERTPRPAATPAGTPSRDW